MYRIHRWYGICKVYKIYEIYIINTGPSAFIKSMKYEGFIEILEYIESTQFNRIYIIYIVYCTCKLTKFTELVELEGIHHFLNIQKFQISNGIRNDPQLISWKALDYTVPFNFPVLQNQVERNQTVIVGGTLVPSEFRSSVGRHPIEMRRTKLIFTMSLLDEASAARKISFFLTAQQFSSPLPDGLLFAESVILVPRRDSNTKWRSVSRRRPLSMLLPYVNRRKTTGFNGFSLRREKLLVPRPSRDPIFFLRRDDSRGRSSFRYCQPSGPTTYPETIRRMLPAGCKKIPFYSIRRITSGEKGCLWTAWSCMRSLVAMKWGTSRGLWEVRVFRSSE